MLSIELNDVRFRAFHGVYPEEKILGGDYLVHIRVAFLPGQTIIRELEESLNYESLYRIAKERMEVPTPLIETIAMLLVQDIRSEFPFLRQVLVRIEKCYPPIEGFVGKVAVENEWVSS